MKQYTSIKTMHFGIGSTNTYSTSGARNIMHNTSNHPHKILNILTLFGRNIPETAANLNHFIAST
jgi:hypothetical protein